MKRGFTSRAVDLAHIPPEKLKKWAFIHDPLQGGNLLRRTFWAGKARYSPSFICRACQIFLVQYGVSWEQAEARRIARQIEAGDSPPGGTQNKDLKPSELPGFEQVETLLGQGSLLHFNQVQSFRFYREEDDVGEIRAQVELILKKWDEPQALLGIRFRGVVDVSFSGFAHISGLYIQSIRERGWEKLRYEVGDYEEGKIHLFCEDIVLFDGGR